MSKRKFLYCREIYSRLSVTNKKIDQLTLIFLLLRFQCNEKQSTNNYILYSRNIYYENCYIRKCYILHKKISIVDPYNFYYSTIT